ncbi:MAG TPA: GDSL-type esterase/lipase family protein [Planctomycetota bacterium]|nr:GDSL-type esterase/lipase family protein [Planctomycetota bacterium]
MNGEHIVVDLAGVPGTTERRAGEAGDRAAAVGRHPITDRRHRRQATPPRSWWRAFVALVAATFLICVAAQEPSVPAVPRRVVFIGDSITDGNTYPQLVRQALSGAGRGRMLAINAGIGGDTAAGMAKRIARDVLPRRPDLATLSVGVNDTLRQVEQADYERDVIAICDQLAAAQVGVLLLTTCLLDGPNEPANVRLRAYNAFLRALAAQRGLLLADVEAQYAAARERGEIVLETDHVHPDWNGHRLYARAVLDALGHGDVAVPAELIETPLPGILPAWRIAAFASGAPALDPAAVAADAASWTEVRLPITTAHPTWWLDHERQRGFAVALDRLVGPGASWRSFAVLDAAAERAAMINLGGGVTGVWLDGERIFAGGEWTGWHPGNHRISVVLSPGRHELAVESGADFFLSITDDDSW